MAGANLGRRLAAGVAAALFVLSPAVFSPALAQQAPAESPTQAADARFVDALGNYVAKPSVETRLELIEVAKLYFAVWNPDEAFPGPRSPYSTGYYDAKDEALSAAEAAQKSGDLARAVLGFRLGVALYLGDPTLGPPEPLEGSDIYTVVPLITALVADRRHDEALEVIRALLKAPASEVRETLFIKLTNDMSDISRKGDLDAIQAFANMGLAAATGSDARSVESRNRFNEALRALANRRIYDAVPDRLAAPDAARLSPEQRSAADGLFLAGLIKLAANDQAAGAADMLAAARLYAAAWEGPLAVPDTAIGRREYGSVLYDLTETLGKDGEPAQLDLAHRLTIAINLSDPGGPPEPSTLSPELAAIWATPPDTDGNVLESDDGYQVAQLGRALIRLDRFGALLELAKVLRQAPDPAVAVQMTGMLTDLASEARQPDRLQQAEKLARAGLDLYSDEQSRADGYTAQFTSLLNWTFEQVPPPDYATLLGLPVPERLSADDRARADDLFLRATKARFNGEHQAALPLFAEAATLYMRAWPVDFGIPEYRLYQLKLASAATASGDAALDADDAPRAELALRFAEALGNADIPDPNYGSVYAFRTRLIAMLAYRQGAADQARSLLLAMIQSNNADAIAEPAGAFSNEIYALQQAGRLNDAEAAARFAVELYRGTTGKAGFAFARLAREYGGILSLKNQSELATEWLQIGWLNRDQANVDEGKQAAAALVANLVGSGRLVEARSLIAEQAGGPATLGREAFKWLLGISASGNKADSLALLRLAQQIFEGLAKRDPDDQSDLLFALGSAEFEAGNFGAAERLYRRALAETEQRFGLDSGLASLNIQNLAAVLLAQGQVDEAEALFRRYWQIADSYPTPNPTAFEEALSNLLDVLVRQNKLTEADELSGKALERFSQPGVAEPLPLAGFETTRATVLLALGRGAEAEALLRSAVERSPNDRSRRMLAIALEAQGKPDEAAPIYQALYDEALKGNFFAGPYSEARLSLQTSLARNFALRGKVAEADAIFAKTVETLSSVFGSQSSTYAAYAESYARHLLATDRLEQARIIAESVLAARSALQSKVDTSASDTTRLALARGEADAAALLLRILARGSGRDDPATLALFFSTLQRAETSAAGLALARSAASSIAEEAGASDAVIVWRAAQARLAEVDAKIVSAAAAGARGDAERRAAVAQRNAADSALQRAQADLTARFPGFFDLINPQPLPLAGLQGGKGLLRADEALVILSPGHAGLDAAEQTGTVMVVTREGAAWADLPLSRAALSSTISRFHKSLDKSGATDAPGYEAPETVFSRAESFALYQSLFGAPQIAALLASKAQWTLAPQGVFASLPFAALVTEAPPGGSAGDTDPAMLRSTRWLGLQKALAVTPSVSIIGIQRQMAARPPAGARLPFFGLGDPAFKGVADPPLVVVEEDTAERGARPTRGVRGAETPLRGANSYVRGGETDISAVNALSRLTGTATEIRALAGLLGAADDAIVLQLGASEAEIRRRNAIGSLRQTDVIALATHGLLAGELTVSAVEPALALTPPVLATPDALPTSENDGLLTASEAAQLSLSARFVILSACNTAASGKPDADSLSGLARAFFFAGAQALLVTHFYVYDSAAPLLTGKAIQLATEQGMGSAEAMRQSMAALAANEQQDATGQSFAHPKAWAAFAVLDAN